jgi:hypothetical protein
LFRHALILPQDYLESKEKAGPHAESFIGVLSADMGAIMSTSIRNNTWKTFQKDGLMPAVNYQYEKRKKELEKKKKRDEKLKRKEIKKNIKPKEEPAPSPEK